MEQEKKEKVSYPYPEELFDEDGYPTEEALEYINNWTIVYKGEEMYVGQYFADIKKQTDLLEYVKSLWTYDMGVVHTKNVFELHTVGWSGNESIVRYFKNTSFWLMHHFMTITGGHYYFTLAPEGRAEIIKSLKD